MSSSISSDAGRPDIAGVTRDGLAAWLEAHGERPYRAGQILAWVHRRGAASFDDMTDVGRTLRAELARSFRLTAPSPVRVERATDGTTKLLFDFAGPPRSALAETVVIPQRDRDDGARDRLTLCLSSQAGCGMGCEFCATAALGLTRNLTAAEVVTQVAAGARLAAPAPVTNLVFMGMGEPLANYPAVRDALGILTAEWGWGISPRRITVSTVGLAPLIPVLVAETQVNLAISLHGTTDAQRERLVPPARRYPLGVLMAACRAVPLPRRKRITFEYVLLAGENDADADARRLVALMHGLPAKVNLIPFNAFPGTTFRPTPPWRVRAFQRLLLAGGVSATVRETRGADIQAACGQLAGGRHAA
jgi:23S rRNA (adenine2503-C2)-methyltransferase